MNVAAEQAERNVLVALGGNVGEVLEAFRRAVDAMPALGLHPRCLSRVYRTRPELLPGASPQPDYVNAAVLVATNLQPLAVMGALQSLEREAGARGAARWAPRRLDLDYVDDEKFVHQSAELTLPHPRAHLRRFVLAPVADVAPGWAFGGHLGPVVQLLAQLPGGVGELYGCQLSWRAAPLGPSGREKN